MRCSRPCFLCNRNAISTRFWQWSTVRCGCLGRNTKRCKLRIRPSNSTSTPGRHDGFFFSFVHFLCYLWMLLFPVWGEYIHCLLQGELLYIFLRFCGSAFQVSPVFVTTQGNVLPPLCCGLLYNFFALALFFIGVATLFKNRLGLSLPRGLTRRVTWFNLSKIIYRWWVQHVGGVNAFLIYVLIIQKTATNPCEPNEG